MKNTLIILLFIFCANKLFAQNTDIVLSDLKKLFSYDSLRAISDIENDSIFILNFSGIGHYGAPSNTDEDLNYIERQFGFSYKHAFFEVPNEGVLLKQEEYNRQVCKYLDSTLQINSKEEIKIECARLVLERIIIFNQTDECINEYVTKEFRKEKKKFKSQLIEADKSYRDKKFENALLKYQELKKQVETEKGLLYLQTSEYHCLMNLEAFDKARMLTKYNINRITKKVKH